MGLSGAIRSVVSAAFVALPTVICVAAEPDICTVAAHPANFDHQRLSLEGIVTGLMKSTSRTGKKYLTFLLSSRTGCGGVLVYAQGPPTLSNGDHLRVEGVFEVEHRRDSSTFHNEMQVTKITALPHGD